MVRSTQTTYSNLSPAAARCAHYKPQTEVTSNPACVPSQTDPELRGQIQCTAQDFVTETGARLCHVTLVLIITTQHKKGFIPNKSLNTPFARDLFFHARWDP